MPRFSLGASVVAGSSALGRYLVSLDLDGPSLEKGESDESAQGDQHIQMRWPPIDITWPKVRPAEESRGLYGELDLHVGPDPEYRRPARLPREPERTEAQVARHPLLVPATARSLFPGLGRARRAPCPADHVRSCQAAGGRPSGCPSQDRGDCLTFRRPPVRRHVSTPGSYRQSAKSESKESLQRLKVISASAFQALMRPAHQTNSTN